MRRGIALASIAAATLLGAELQAQAVPDNSAAARVRSGYRRPLNYRMDPFRHVFNPGWGLTFSAGAWAEINSLNIKDARALQYIADNDTVLVTDLLDAIGLIPQGAGLGISSVGEGGVFLGGPIGGHLSIGLSAQAREYGGGFVDDDMIAPFRDGNSAREEFPLGDTHGEALATAEVGAHVLVKLGPIGSVDGAVLTLGVGGRYLWPQAYARVKSIGAGQVLRIGSDELAAKLDIETIVSRNLDSLLVDSATTISGFSSLLPTFDRGTGMAGDVMLRIEWPTSGFAVEGILTNIGTVTIDNVVRRIGELDVRTTNLSDFADSLDAFEWDSTVARAEVNLPRLARVSASGWANRILQLDVSASWGLNTGEYDMPLAVDLGSTWRLVRQLPIRLGVVVGGHQRFGYTGGIAVETGNFVLQFAGASLGGLFGGATGAAGRFDLGFFF